MKVGDRLEGHFVLGHIDGVATITKIEKKPKEVKIWFKIPKKLTKYVVKKGSIALDGISLTLVDVKKRCCVCLSYSAYNQCYKFQIKKDRRQA